jgi:hypothetical protein
LQDKNKKLVREASRSYFYFKNDHDDDDNSAKAEVSEFIIHPDWDPEEIQYKADIAVAVLKKPIKISKKIRHVCLNTPSHPIQNFAGRNGKVYGWGLNEEMKMYSDLQDVEVPLINQELCYKTVTRSWIFFTNEERKKIANLMSDNSFCAGAKDGRTGPCNGNF